MWSFRHREFTVISHKQQVEASQRVDTGAVMALYERDVRISYFSFSVLFFSLVE
jgi:hypothetical protein